jgi:hypothetical protein
VGLGGPGEREGLLDRDGELALIGKRGEGLEATVVGFHLDAADRVGPDQHLGLNRLRPLDFLKLKDVGPSQLPGDDRLQRRTSTRWSCSSST